MVANVNVTSGQVSKIQTAEVIYFSISPPELKPYSEKALVLDMQIGVIE